MTEPLIEKLDIHPGELLVVRFPAHTYRRDIDEWVKTAKAIIPEGIGVMVLVGDVKLAIVKAELAVDEDYDVREYQWTT